MSHTDLLITHLRVEGRCMHCCPEGGLFCFLNQVQLMSRFPHFSQAEAARGGTASLTIINHSLSQLNMKN